MKLNSRVDSNTKDTLYFLFRCKKITRQKFNYELALSLLEHEKKRQSSKFFRDSKAKESLIINSKNEIEEKLKLKDDQIYDLESKLKLQETKVAELNTRIGKGFVAGVEGSSDVWHRNADGISASYEFLLDQGQLEIE